MVNKKNRKKILLSYGHLIIYKMIIKILHSYACIKNHPTRHRSS